MNNFDKWLIDEYSTNDIRSKQAIICSHYIDCDGCPFENMQDCSYYSTEVEAWLESENKESCEDAISRKTVMYVFKKHEEHCVAGDSDKVEVSYDTDAIYQDIQALQSVEPTRPHGEWKYVDYGNGCGNWHCTSCRNICVEMRLAKNNYNFCPNCGADMRGDNNENTN